MGHRQRKRLFIDAKVQGALLMRAAIYWLCCIAIMNVMLICWEVFATPGSIGEIRYDQIWYRYAPALATALLMLPFILLDTVRITNRMVGPIYRLRQSMRKLALGKTVQPIRFRQDDFWFDMSDEFNALIALVERLQAGKPAQNAESSPTADRTDALTKAAH